MTDRIQDLYDEEVEINILAIALTNPSKIGIIISTLTQDDFYQRSHQFIFSAIKELYEDNKTVDIITVSNLLKFKNLLQNIGGRKTINDIVTYSDMLGNLESLFKIIIKYSKKRKLIELCRESIDNLSNSTDVDIVSDNLIIKAQDLLTRSSKPQFTSLESGFDEFFEDVEALYNSNTGTLGLPTGIKGLDNNLSGLVGGKFYILGARPAMGKSLLAQQIGEYVAENKNVLFFSLEMSSKEYASRSCYRQTGLNQDYITRGNEEQKEMALEKIVKAREYMANNNLKIIADSSTNLLTIEKNILQCKRHYKTCDLVIVDYLQLMEPTDSKITDDYKIVTDNSRGLKKLAMKYNVPIIALCQLSRQLEQRADKRPLLSDLRDSGAIEQDADVVMFLYRDYYYNKNPINKEKAELQVAKNRSGRCGEVIRLTFNSSKMIFKETVPYG